MDDIANFTVGQRIKLARTHAGKSRAVLGGLVGMSPEWVKAIENGRLLPPRLPMLARIARALKVPLADLAGDIVTREDNLTLPGHAALPAVRDALNRWPSAGAEPQSLDHIAARLDAAWRARHASADHRTVLGRLLPGLIRDAHTAAGAADDAHTRRRARAILADVLGLTQMFVAYQPDHALLWRVADRAMIAAQDSADPRAIAGATWFLVEAHRDAGDWDTAMDLNLDALAMLEPRLADAAPELTALYGALQAAAALTAARAGEQGRAWRHWDQAHRTAATLPAGYVQPWTWFSPPVVGFYAVSVAVELSKGGEALRQARRIPPHTITSRPRRARHLVEVARANRLRRDHEAALHAVEQAHAAAPETIRWNSYARQIVAEQLNSPPRLQDRARDLAMRIGMTS